MITADPEGSLITSRAVMGASCDFILLLHFGAYAAPINTRVEPFSSIYPCNSYKESLSPVKAYASLN